MIYLCDRAEKHPFERVATPYQVYSWMVPNMEHCVDSIRAEDGEAACHVWEEGGVSQGCTYGVPRLSSHFISS